MEKIQLVIVNKPKCPDPQWAGTVEYDLAIRIYDQSYKRWNDHVSEYRGEFLRMCQERRRMQDRGEEGTQEFEDLMLYINRIKACIDNCEKHTYEIKLPDSQDDGKEYKTVLGKKSETVLQTFFVEPELKDLFSSYCKRRGFTVSHAIRELMKAELVRDSLARETQDE